MQYVLPDYGNSGLNAAASILRHFGAETNQTGHPDVDALLLHKAYKNIVFMLFDGLGMATLADHLPPNSFLRTHVRRRMTAVFPPTTVAATTSIESGMAPCEHGWLGWSLYLAPLDRTVDVFTNMDSVTGEPLPGEGRAIDRLMPYCNIVQRLNGTGRVQAQIVSKHGDTHVDTLEELLETVKVRYAAPGRQYIYTYYNEPDHTMHDAGTMGVGELVREIDSRVETLCRDLPENTLVLVTADHGLTDAVEVPLEDFPELTAACVRPFHIEGRAASFFVKPECRAFFPALFEKYVGTEDFLFLSRDQAVSMGLFGPGPEHPAFRDLLGDYLAVAIGTRSLA